MAEKTRMETVKDIVNQINGDDVLLMEVLSYYATENNISKMSLKMLKNDNVEVVMTSKAKQ